METLNSFLQSASIFSLIFAVIIIIAAIVVTFLRKKDEKLHEYNLTFLHIKLPKENEYEISAAEHMFASLSGLKQSFFDELLKGRYRISFEMVSKTEGISFFVVVPDEILSFVEKQINGVYPDAEIDVVNPNEIWDRGSYTRIAELKLSGKPFSPIKLHDEISTDPLNLLTSAMSKLSENEVVALQFVISPAKDVWRNAGHKYLSDIRSKMADPEKNYRVDETHLQAVEKKLSNPGFYTSVRVVSISENKSSSLLHINNMVSAFSQFNNVSQNKFRYKKYLFKKRAQKKLIDLFIYRKLSIKEIYIPVLDIDIYRNVSILNTVELATIFHLPNNKVQTPNIVWLGARRSAAPMDIPLDTEGIWVGESDFRGVKKQIFLKEKDRTRHFYIIGQTGTGKSELLKYMALQDIRNGEGIALIDPHGTDVQDLLMKIPEERVNDVIYFNASDLDRPMGLNLLEHQSEEDKHIVINSFIALLYKLYDPNRQGIIGPQLERAIRNVMLTAMVDKNSTMVDVLRLLIDQNYANKFIDKLTDPLVKKYWTDEMAKTSDFHKSEKMGYFVSKFDKFVTDKLMRNILGQPQSAFNISEVMSSKKILLVDLAKGKIGEENSNFLGLILVPKILSAALNRHHMIEKGFDFPDFYLYVDEFQNFATPDFETILSEARKYKLNLTIAHQFIEQLPDEIRNAIFGNVGSMCTFRVGMDDAEFLEQYYTPTFTKRDISNLAIGTAYTRLLVNGHPTPPFSINIPWDKIHTNVPKNIEVAERIKLQSRQMYGKDVKDVEDYINYRAGHVEQEEQKEPIKRLPF